MGVDGGGGGEDPRCSGAGREAEQVMRLPSAMRCSGTWSMTLTLRLQERWDAQTRPITQLTTLIKVRVVLLIGLRGEPGKKRERERESNKRVMTGKFTFECVPWEGTRKAVKKTSGLVVHERSTGSNQPAKLWELQQRWHELSSWEITLYLLKPAAFKLNTANGKIWKIVVLTTFLY